MDGNKIIITEAFVRRDLQLADENGVECLLNSAIFEQLTLAKTTAWNEFSSTIASAIVCLATNQKFNFSKYIFESMVKNLENVSGNFLMYPSDTVTDEAVYKERDDSLVRAATTASSLEAEQDSGNIDKTQSKATTILTKFPKINTPSNDEDSMNLKELVEFYTKFQQRVLDLENTKTAQAHEITSLKLRGDQEDASKQGRKIDDIDKDAEITLVDETQGRYGDDLMFDIGVLDDEEVFAEPEVAAKDVNYLLMKLLWLNAASTKVSVVSASTMVSAAAITTATIPTSRKGIVIAELGISTTTITRTSQQPSQATIQDKGKGKMVEPKLVKKLSKNDQLKLDEKLAFKLQVEEEEEEKERLAREKS
ncbi:hypothetical protein Tco_1014283 [Tanacetum coccineum]